MPNIFFKFFKLLYFMGERKWITKVYSTVVLPFYLKVKSISMLIIWRKKNIVSF